MNKRSSKITLKDIAKEAKVSTTIASQVINDVPGVRVSDITKIRILKIADELNYYPNRIAKSLVSGKTNIIGIAISGFVTPVFLTSFFTELIQGAGHELEEYGFNLLLFQPNRKTNSDKLWKNTVLSGLLEGILLEGNFIKDEFVLKLDDKKFPYVLMGRKLVQREINYVALDYFGGSYSAVEHLIKLGHKRIGFIGAPILKDTMTNMIDRKKGYIHALNENRIKTSNDFMTESSDFSVNEGYRQMEKLLKSRIKPTAILAAHDSLAIGAMDAIRENKLRVPEDIAVIGFDDIPEALNVYPKLTTIKYPLYDLGKESAKMLSKIISHEENEIIRQKVLPTKLIIRDSCGG